MSSGEPDPIDIAVGARLRYQRQLLKVSQDALGEAVGVSFQQIQKYERGSNRISASMLVHLAERLGIKPSTLLGDHGLDDDSDAQLLALVRHDGAVDLLDAFTRLRPGLARRRIVDLVRAMADAADLR